MRHKPFIIPIFVPHMGCPHRCVFCNQVAITGHSNGKLTRQEVAGRISQFLGYKGVCRGSVEIAFYGGNFLGLPEAYRRDLLTEARRFVEAGKVDGVRFSTRPDTIQADTLETLAPYAVQSIELGVQSMDDEILSLSRRGHTAQDTKNAVERLRSRGVNIGMQIMPGLPGDTAATILETGEKVAELEPDFVRIYPTVVVSNTVLEKWYRSGRFVPLSLQEAVSLSKELYLLFNRRGISVIRMGLQSTESLRSSDALIAGPFHPAFGHLVHSAVFLDRVIEMLRKQETLSDRISIKVHPDDVPRARGLKNGNVLELTRRFGLKQLRIIPDPAVPRDTLRIVDEPANATR